MHEVRKVVLSVLWVGIVSMSGCGADALYEILTPDPAVRLPKDEAPHSSGGEWWYYTGSLKAETGANFGIEAVIFHFSGLRYLIPYDIWAAHYAVLRESDGYFLYSQTNYFGHGPDQPNEGGFNLYTQLIEMSGVDGHDHVSALLADGSYKLDMDLTDQRGVILHGPGGYITYGDTGLHSFYYSRPRMHATGTLEVDGQPLAVTGEFWFDRQWGRDVINPDQSWDWFSLRLDDGSDIMLFVFAEADPPMAEGTYIPPVGDAVPLAGEDFTVTPTEWWTSPWTEITYPVAWEVKILSQDLVLTVKAKANDQELDVKDTTLNIYWEGSCTITGTRSGQPITGTAYIELANYKQIAPE